MDCWLIKLDASSNIVWENTFGGLADDSIGDIKILPNGNLLVAATSNSDKSTDKSEDIKGDSDIWLLMLDASGDIMWDKTIGGSLEDGGLQLARTSNGRNFLTGFSTSNTSGDKIFNNNDRFPDCWLIEFNDLGEIINQFVIGGNGRDMPKALHYNQNGNLFIGMQSTSLNNTGDKKLTQDVSYVGNFWLMEWDIQ